MLLLRELPPSSGGGGVCVPMTQLPLVGSPNADWFLMTGQTMSKELIVISYLGSFLDPILGRIFLASGCHP